MKIDNEFLKKHSACMDGVKWFLKQKKTDVFIIIKNLVKDDHWDWANWLVTRLMHKKQNVQYAIFAAESVIDIYKKKYSKDNRPQKAIQAAKNYLKNPYKKTKNASATDAAYADYAASATYAAYAAAYAADDANNKEL